MRRIKAHPKRPRTPPKTTRGPSLVQHSGQRLDKSRPQADDIILPSVVSDNAHVLNASLPSITASSLILFYRSLPCAIAAYLVFGNGKRSGFVQKQRKVPSQPDTPLQSCLKHA